MRNNQLEIFRKNSAQAVIALQVLAFHNFHNNKRQVHLESTAKTRNEKYTRRITDAKSINSSKYEAKIFNRTHRPTSMPLKRNLGK